MLVQHLPAVGVLFLVNQGELGSMSITGSLEFVQKQRIHVCVGVGMPLLIAR